MKARNFPVIVLLQQLIVLVQSADDPSIEIRQINVLGYGSVNQNRRVLVNEDNVEESLVSTDAAKILINLDLASDICPERSSDQIIFEVGQFLPFHKTLYCQKWVNMTITLYHDTGPDDIFSQTILGSSLEFDKTYLQGYYDGKEQLEKIPVDDTLMDTDYANAIIDKYPSAQFYVAFNVKHLEGDTYECYSFALTTLVMMMYLAL